MSLIEISSLSTCCHGIPRINCENSIKIAILLTLQFSCMVSSLTRPTHERNERVQHQFHDKLNSGKNKRKKKLECQLWTFFVCIWYGRGFLLLTFSFPSSKHANKTKLWEFRNHSVVACLLGFFTWNFTSLYFELTGEFKRSEMSNVEEKRRLKIAFIRSNWLKI